MPLELFAGLISGSSASRRRTIVLCLLSFPPAYAQEYSFANFAGFPGAASHLDGTAGQARFNQPRSVAVDALGNVYVTENFSHAIRRITPTGVVSTWAGSQHTQGSTDGETRVARFSSPTGLAVDRIGNVYVADTGNHVVRKITPAGRVTTLAGLAGVPGRADGAGSAARFSRVHGIAVDNVGSVYVTDDPASVRSISSAGVVTTLDGIPGVGGPPVYFANDVAVDSAANVYVLVSDPESFDRPKVYMMRRGAGWQLIGDIVFVSRDFRVTIYATTGLAVDRTGTVFVATVGGIVTLSSATARRAVLLPGIPTMDVAPDSAGNLYVANTVNHTLIKAVRTPALIESPEYVFTTLAGSAFQRGTADGIGPAARFDRPGEIAVDRAGNVYIADSGTIRKISPDATVRTIAGLAGASVESNAGNIDGVGTTARFRAIAGLAVDSKGNAYVTEVNSRHSIRQIAPDGTVTTFAGHAMVPGMNDGPAALARFNNPRGLAVDEQDNLYVADMGNLMIRKLSTDGDVSTAVNLKALPRPALDPRVIAGNAPLAGPATVAIDREGNLYFTDISFIWDGEIDGTWNVNTWRASSDGEITAWPKPAEIESPPIFHPTVSAVDGSNNAYLADRQTIIRITPAGDMHTLGGAPGQLLHADGLGETARFHTASRLALDPAGNIYIADPGSFTLRKGVPVVSGEPASRLVSLSVRAHLPAGQTIRTGLTVRGGSLPVLARAIGPGLRPFIDPGVAVAGDPRLEVYDEERSFLQWNDRWSATAALTNVFAAVGAFPLFDESPDAALVQSMTGEMVTDIYVRSPGIGLFEAYDAGRNHAARLVAMSARRATGAGERTFISGFVVQGTGQKTILLRGLGPGITQAGVITVADPKIELFNSAAERIAENDNVSESLASLVVRAGAAPSPVGSKDAGLLISLQPGTYTVVLSSADGTFGEGQIEIYEVP